jgi:phage terminase Nu1 subunit (DNA packaging protein)
MQTESETLHREIIQEIATALSYAETAVPAQINQEQAAAVLGVKPATLCNWRCTGRYALPYVRAGRLIRYRVADLAAWIAKRRAGMEG